MRRAAFIITLIGLAILSTQLHTEGTPLKNKSDLKTLLPGSTVHLHGTVQKDTQQGFTLNNITIHCKECTPLTGKTISIRGRIEEYRGNKRIRALRIKQHYLK